MAKYLDSKLAVGDRVRYSSAFLRSAGIYTAEHGAFRAGTFLGFADIGNGREFGRVQWDDAAADRQLVNLTAIWGAERLHSEPA